MPVELDESTLQIIGLSIDVVASIILTLHVILIHSKLQVSNTGQGLVVLNDRESIEAILLYISVGLFVISFFFLIWSALLTNSNRKKERYLLERHLDIDLTDFSGVSMDQVNTFNKQRHSLT